MSDPIRTGEAAAGPLDAHLSRLLRAHGIQRLPAVFMFPVAEHGQRQWCRYPFVTDVAWRNRSKPFYVRSPGTPFEIVPLRPKDPARAGSWYSLGPALEGGTLLDEVLLAQVVGQPAEVAKGRNLILSLIHQACAAVPGRQVRVRAETTGESGRPEWVSYCLAVSLVCADEP
jgi:hypothetical protein